VENLFISSRYLSNNNIAQLKKNFFEDAPLNGNFSAANNDIGWIEDGTFAHISSMNLLYVHKLALTSCILFFFLDFY
jgi:hypothetical protein